MTDFANKTVWITGASSGIGEALAYKFSKLGAKLLISSRDETRLNEVRAACDNPLLHHVVPMDLERYRDLDAVAEETWKEYGPIDVLINNAGVSQRYRVDEGEIELDEKIMNINFLGTIALTRPVLRKMLERQSGHIAVVSSVLGLFGIQSRSAYCASKHALRGYFESLRNELSGSKIDLTMIYPGYVKTNVSRNAITVGGRNYGVTDKQHSTAMSSEDSAEKIVAAIKRKKPILIFGGTREMASVYLSKNAPSVFRFLSSRIKV